jgi:hypothetical protein
MDGEQVEPQPLAAVAPPLMGEQVIDLVREAIRDRNPLAGRYHGDDRWLSPSARGRRYGESHLLAFQTAGGSESGLPKEGQWRCLRAEDLESVHPAPGPWRTAENLLAARSGLDGIDLVVQPLPARRRRGSG